MKVKVSYFKLFRLVKLFGLYMFQRSADSKSEIQNLCQTVLKLITTPWFSSNPCSWFLDALRFYQYFLIKIKSFQVVAALLRPRVPEHLGDNGSLAISFFQIWLTDARLILTLLAILIHECLLSKKIQFKHT